MGLDKSSYLPDPLLNRHNNHNLRSKLTERNCLFDYFNPFSIASGVGGSKEKISKKNLYPKKKLKNCKIFHWKFWRHRKISIPRVSILVIYFIYYIVWSSWIFEKNFHFLNNYNFIFCYLVSSLRSITGWNPTAPKPLK